MSYASIAAIRQDPWLRDRIAACVAVEGVGVPEEWVPAHSWQLAAQPGWGDSWASSLVTHPEDDYSPGQDEGVISDAAILAAVQSIQAAEQAEQEVPE